MRIRLLGIAVAAAIVSGCSTTPDCLDHQAYMDAQSFPPLKSPPGLEVPEPDSAMTIPEVGDGPVGTYAETPRGADTDDPAARCLTAPPAMAQR